jgi:hypothetical protein
MRGDDSGVNGTASGGQKELIEHRRSEGRRRAAFHATAPVLRCVLVQPRSGAVADRCARTCADVDICWRRASQRPGTPTRTGPAFARRLVLWSLASGLDDSGENPDSAGGESVAGMEGG